MWTTNVRIRALAQSCLQLELPIYGFDQKGIYMNEAGSKNVGMLALDGETLVALKDNHAAGPSCVFAHSWQSLGGAMLAAGAWLFT